MIQQEWSIVAVSRMFQHGTNKLSLNVYFYTKEKSSSSRAAFFTKVAKEEARLLELLGGNKTTLYTFAGIGDLLLTATSNESRNFSYGEALANNLINDKLTTVKKLTNL